MLIQLDKTQGTSRGKTLRCNVRGFTLIQLLVVLAILLTLVAILLPALSQSRMRAKVLRVHSDLRQIGLALEGYTVSNNENLPPTRSGCGTNVTYQLPVELAIGGFLPRHPSLIPQADFPDTFNPQHSYKYLAPGPIWFNGQFFDFPNSTWRPRAGIWVPSDFPACQSEDGQFYHNRKSEPRSPVAYAIWSIGRDPKSDKFPIDPETGTINASRFPLPKKYWMLNAGDTGLITHFRDRHGKPYMSP